jgi:pimeloyl-ACP methyl ester carboxylesterase
LNLPSYFLSRDAVDFANAFVSLLSQGEDHMTKKWIYLLCALILGAAPAFTDNNRPKPLGKMVDLGGHRLHVNCTGKGRPTVVVENGLGDFSFDWILVQSRVSEFTRICAYDRAGYAWSDPGPKPRTFAQINLELRDALSKLGERGPFILVGHSYGGAVVRNFATTYPAEVAAMVLVDSAFEGERVGIGGGRTIRLGENAQGRAIPAPREQMNDSDRSAIPHAGAPADEPLDAMYKTLPPAMQKLQIWAQSQAEIQDAEDSQREWSEEYFAKWLAQSQNGILGALPLIVLTRAEGGFKDGASDVSAAQMEQERKQGQAKLALLSTNGKQIKVHGGHNMELEAPDEVVAAIREVVEAIRQRQRL